MTTKKEQQRLNMEKCNICDADGVNWSRDYAVVCNHLSDEANERAYHAIKVARIAGLNLTYNEAVANEISRAALGLVPGDNPQTTADKLESVSTRHLMDLILLVETRNGTTNLRIASLNEYERLGRHATTLLEVPFDVEMNSCAAQDRVLSDLGGLAKIIGG